MSDAAFDAFVAALRDVMASRNHDTSRLDLAPDRSHVRIPCTDGSWFVVHRDHLETEGCTTHEMAEAVYGVYCEDTADGRGPAPRYG